MSTGPPGRGRSRDTRSPPPAGRAFRTRTTRPGRRARWSARPGLATPMSARSLALGPGAERWLITAAAAGAQRVRRKMAEAVDLAKLDGTEEVDRALRACAEAGRFGDGDLASILAHQRQQGGGELILFPARSE